MSSRDSLASRCFLRTNDEPAMFGCNLFHWMLFKCRCLSEVLDCMGAMTFTLNVEKRKWPAKGHGTGPELWSQSAPSFAFNIWSNHYLVASPHKRLTANNIQISLNLVLRTYPAKLIPWRAVLHIVVIPLFTLEHRCHPIVQSCTSLSSHYSVLYIVVVPLFSLVHGCRPIVQSCTSFSYHCSVLYMVVIPLFSLVHRCHSLVLSPSASFFSNLYFFNIISLLLAMSRHIYLSPCI